ncbi:LmbE family protein [Verrucomicrobia bacterium]|nr:LmbE family protein [Verrucomicrobiota bacterium]
MNANPYLNFVSGYARLLQDAKSYPLGKLLPAPRPSLGADAPNALFFAPHPDDECIIGGLAVRLLREGGFKVQNVAVTLGSKKERQAARLRELEGACGYLGFGLLPTAPNGLERINVKTRSQDPTYWNKCVQVIAGLLSQHQPRIILLPHEQDWNSTHIGTHFLVMDALQALPAGFECYLVETEFWGQMSDPNLMVEISAQDLADMIAATTFHVGEVERNPYHLLLPAWMLDNVRRGAELVGGQGGAAPAFTFAALYRVRKWGQGRAVKFFEGGQQISCASDVRRLFP